MVNEDAVKRQIANYVRKIEASHKITPRNKEFLIEFKRKCSIDPDIGVSRLRQLICHSYCIGELFGPLDFVKATRQDIDIILSSLGVRLVYCYFCPIWHVRFRLPSRIYYLLSSIV